MFLPLHSGERSFGTLTVTSAQPLPGDLRQSLETLRTQIALALDGAALTATLTALTRQDPLTGLANRAALADHDQHNADTVGRAVLVIDLDGFQTT